MLKSTQIKCSAQLNIIKWTHLCNSHHFYDFKALFGPPSNNYLSLSSQKWPLSWLITQGYIVLFLQWNHTYNMSFVCLPSLAHSIPDRHIVTPGCIYFLSVAAYYSTEWIYYNVLTLLLINIWFAGLLCTFLYISFIWWAFAGIPVGYTFLCIFFFEL